MSLAYSAWYGWEKYKDLPTLKRVLVAIGYGYSDLGGWFWRDTPRKKTVSLLLVSLASTLIDLADWESLPGTHNTPIVNFLFPTVVTTIISSIILYRLFPEKGAFNILAGFSVGLLGRPYTLLAEYLGKHGYTSSLSMTEKLEMFAELF